MTDHTTTLDTRQEPTMPAHSQAAIFTALATHLDQHPTLPYVVVHRAVGGDVDTVLQITSVSVFGEPVDAHAVLLWARTLSDVVISLQCHGDPSNHATKVAVTGGMEGIRVEVWDVEHSDLWRWVIGDITPEELDRLNRILPVEITVNDLAAYVAAGTVDGITLER
jgi:hypothetical protein